MVDLSTTYLGLQLKNPVVASASPISKKLDGIRSLEDAGAGAVVMYSLFEEQIVHESLALDYYPKPRHGYVCRSNHLLPGPDSTTTLARKNI